MTVMYPYSRRIRVLIGPLEEWRGGGDESLALKFEADGTQNNFRIKFDVHKHVMSTATPTVIQIYNLSRELRDALVEKKNIKVALFVGWDNTELTLLYSGSLLAAVNQRQGADIVTNLMSNAAFGSMSRSVISGSFAGGSTVKNLVEQLARNLEGITVDIKNIQINENYKFGTQGKSYCGMTSEILNNLARTYNFSWYIDNEIFYAIDDNEFISSQQVVINGDSNLLRVEPMLSGPFQVQVGVTITSLLNPWINPGKLVNIKSVINPQLNKDYVVHELSHSGDSHSMTWESRIESFVQVS